MQHTQPNRAQRPQVPRPDPSRGLAPRPAPAPLKPRAARRKRSPWLILVALGGAASVMLLCMLSVTGAVLLLNQDKIAEGVSVAGADVGGMSAEEATALLSQQLQNRPVRLVDGSRQWDSSFAAMGMSLNLDDTLQALSDANANSSVTPRYTLDLNQTQRALVVLADEVNIDAIPGRDARNGRVMEIPVMLDRLDRNALGELSDGVFELSMMDVAPPKIESLTNYTGERSTHIVQPGQELALIAKEYGVDIDDIIALNGISDANLIFVGQELIIPAAGAYVPQDVPPAPLQQGKSIVVDTRSQRIYAYENGQMIRTHLTSTGRTETPTVLGDYRIYVKYEKTNMRGADYFLPDVPYTMYFYQGYGIHGTYWHNSFGRPMSHGCVNLPTEEAQWFFQWAEVGTLVRVI